MARPKSREKTCKLKIYRAYMTFFKNSEFYNIETCASHFDILLGLLFYWLICSWSSLAEYRCSHLSWGQSFQFQISLQHSVWQTRMLDSWILAPSIATHFADFKLTENVLLLCTNHLLTSWASAVFNSIFTLLFVPAPFLLIFKKNVFAHKHIVKWSHVTKSSWNAT